MSPGTLSTTPKLAERLLVIGWDAADWLVIDPLIAEGRMPNLARLIDHGVRADLRTLEPKLSPLLWTSIATGKTCDKHGILNFVEPKPEGDGLRVIQSTTRKTKALWNILSQAGLTTNVVGWYASHPAEPIRGRVVSNQMHEGEPKQAGAPWPLVPGAVHPAELADAVAAARVRSAAFPEESLRALVPMADGHGKRPEVVEKLVKLMAYAASIEAAAHATMQAGPWDATMVFFDAIDTVGHHFMQYRPPRMGHVTEREVQRYGAVMDRVYEWHDAALGRLLERAGPGTTVILVSDHGFHSGAKRPNLKGLPPEQRMELEASWHRPFGILAAAGPGIVAGAACGPCSLLDIAPTALALLGVAAGDDMDGRVLAEIADPALVATRVPSWDAIDGDAGLHPPDLLQDPFEASASIRQLVDLGYLAALPKEAQAQVDLVSRESRFNLATSLIAQQRHADAIPLLRALTAEQPAIVRYGLQLTQCLMAAGEHTEAVSVAQALTKRQPTDPEPRLMLAHALAITGDRESSLRETERVERLAQGRPQFALGLAAVAMQQGRYGAAAAFGAKAVAADPNDFAGHLACARAELAQGRFEEAAGHALDALEITQAIPEAHHLLGVALAWYGDFASALESLEMALRFDPGAAESHAFAALVAQLAHDDEAAVKHRAEALSAATQRAVSSHPYGLNDFAAEHGLASG